MRALEDIMAEYSSFHRDPTNQATHFVGVPMIVFALFIGFGLLKFGVLGGVPITLATAIYIVLAAYYIKLDVVLGTTLTVVLFPMLVVSEWILGFGMSVGVTAFVFFFVLGWIIQLVGHFFEGNRPNLTSNIFQVFAAPIFLVAEVFFKMGLKQDLYTAVEKKILLHNIQTSAAE